MATWEKTKEAYFGDSFNRDATLYSAEIAYDAALDNDCIAIKALNLNDNNTVALACNNAVIDTAKLDNFCGYGNAYAINANIETLNDKFYELQAQINNLKENLETKKECSELRSALKTLHYKREVE